MGNRFDDAMITEQHTTYTENGAKALNTTGGGALLDLFSVAGAMRSRSDEEIVDKFVLAFDENPLLAMKLLFHTRNVRGGLGERRTFRTALKWVATRYPKSVCVNLDLIAEFGRWDDYFTLIDTPVEDDMWDFLNAQFVKDFATVDLGDRAPVSLLAKWLYAPNTSSEEHRRIAYKTAKKFGMHLSEYRKAVSALRKYLNVTERNICDNTYENISYEKVPSQSMRRNSGIFKTHDTERFEGYIKSVAEGKAEIKTGAITPGDIMHDMGINTGYGINIRCVNNPVAEAQWKNLPNYLEGAKGNAIAVVDTSGSMAVQSYPLEMAIGLGIYLSEHLEGAFKDRMITFSSRPSYISFKGCKTLEEKLHRIPSIVENTNLEKVFDLILNTAVKHSVPQSELPSTIMVFTDMEVDAGCSTDIDSADFNERMSAKFKEKGYVMPTIIYWNLDSRHDTFLSGAHGNVQFYSGVSASTFNNVMNSIGMTAYDAMLNTLNNPMYDKVVFVD